MDKKDLDEIIAQKKQELEWTKDLRESIRKGAGHSPWLDVQVEKQEDAIEDLEIEKLCSE